MIRHFPLRLAAFSSALLALAVLASPAFAKKPDPQKTGAQATPLATYGDWAAYSSQQGKSKVCYAITQPKQRLPKTLKRDPGYLFVSFRPAENVKGEISVVLGYPAKDGGPSQIVIGSTSYAVVTKEQNGWIKNPAEEGQVTKTMAGGQNLVVKATSRRGNESSDEYSLKGFSDALKKAREECQ